MKIGAIIRRSIALIILVILLIVLGVLKNNEEVAENFTRYFSSHWLNIASAISAIFPFSLTEVFFVLTFIGIIVLIVFFFIDLKKHHVIKAICKPLDIALIVVSIISAYSLSCEMAYNRKEMPLPYYQEDVAREEYADIYNYFADDLNDCLDHLSFLDNKDVKNPYSLDELAEEVKKAYAIIDDPYFYRSFGAVKPMASSFIYREFQITGVTFSPFGEANIDILSTKNELPFVVAHELAHSKGVMRENDANQLAFYVCLNSDNYYLRYSAYACYFYQLESMVSSAYLTEEERTHLSSVNPIFYQSRNFMYHYWDEHDMLAKIGDWFNDLYIKSSGVSEGTSSYQGGTEYEYDPTTHKIIPSRYQQLFFNRYYA